MYENKEQTFASGSGAYVILLIYELFLDPTDSSVTSREI